MTRPVALSQELEEGLMRNQRHLKTRDEIRFRFRRLGSIRADNRQAHLGSLAVVS